MNETTLRAHFENLAKKLEDKLSHREDSDKTPLTIQDQELAAELGQPSPVSVFVAKTIEACAALFERPVVVESTSPTAANDETTIDDYVKELVNRRSRRTLNATEERRLAATLASDKRFASLQMPQQVRQYAQFMSLDEAIAKALSDHRLATLAERLGGSLRPRAAGPTVDDRYWAALLQVIDEHLDEGLCGCSLIYSYWLDEGGLHVAAERIADRIENGIVATTEALKALHIRESSEFIIPSMSAFIVSWQRGETFDVDARRKQYHALYGFPLHAATAWGAIVTADPRSSFPAAFHNLLYQASRYYDALRDLQKLPDHSAAKSAIVNLLDALREGNENLRVRRTGQLRGQTEYVKRLLGGSATSPLAEEWKQYLTGRPGLEPQPTWRIKADAVADAYRWNRPRAKEYQTLAESGETLLVATRILGEAAVNANDDDTLKAFLLLIKPYVENYVSAFKIVGGVDLGEKLIPAPPAAIMGRRIPLPPIPPLKRDWGVRTPGAARSTAA